MATFSTELLALLHQVHRVRSSATFHLTAGDVFLVPNKTFLVMGGIKVYDLKSVTIQIDGTLIFSNNMDEWPRDSSGHVLHSLHMFNIDNVTFTSGGMGTLDGQGEVWWGIPGVGYLVRGENRPNLLKITDSSNLLVENLFFFNSPCWTFWAENVDRLEVRYCEIR